MKASTLLILIGVALITCASLLAQQATYSGSVVTGQLQLTRTTNVTQIANLEVTASSQSVDGATAVPEIIRRLPVMLPPPATTSTRAGVGSALPALSQGLSVGPSSGTAFDGMSHRDQRLSNNGNQFSVEPPNPSIAVSNGKILEGVNNAIRIFGTTGAPLIPTITSNQLFGLPPAIDRVTNTYGVYTTDMRVFFDQDTNRWFVLQRAQDEDSAGNFLSQSHIYLAVSRTADPAGDYNIYVMDTTDTGNFQCPCVDDYPQIGADRYGFYISANEYPIIDPTAPAVLPNGSMILAISKADLANGVVKPAVSQFVIPLDFSTEYEFAIQPATTPPGASPVLASGGVEFLVSSTAGFYDNNLALWALVNTASLQSGSPNLSLIQTTIPTLPHIPPPDARQRSGPLTLGNALETIDGGSYSDSRVLSVSYSGGRLFVTLASAVVDPSGSGFYRAGGLYVIVSPTLRGGVLSASSPLKQGYLAVANNNILRPAIAANPQGRASIAFTLVGPDYYPSAAFISVDTTAAPLSPIQIVGAGTAPEDGFSGYGPLPACPTCGGFGVARWGDYSTAVADASGSIWSVSEYIPNALRTPLANWGTFISRYIP